MHVQSSRRVRPLDTESNQERVVKQEGKIRIMYDEIQDSVAQDHKPDEDARAAILGDEKGDEPSDDRPDYRHNKTVRPRNVGGCNLLARVFNSRDHEKAPQRSITSDANSKIASGVLGVTCFAAKPTAKCPIGDMRLLFEL